MTISANRAQWDATNNLSVLVELNFQFEKNFTYLSSVIILEFVIHSSLTLIQPD